MSTFFRDYKQAYNFAVREARRLGRVMQLRAGKEYGHPGFIVNVAVQKSEKRFGQDARGEFISPDNPIVNPRGGKFDRCVAEVKRRGGAYNPFAVCRSALKARRKRRRNPRMASYIITAQKPGGRVLRYVGHRKFAERGRAVLFANETSARSVLGLLRLEFPSLRSYTLRVHGGR